MSRLRVALLVLQLVTWGVPRVHAQTVPANARAAAVPKGWSCNAGFLERGPGCVTLAAATDAEVRQHLVNQSIAGYSGSCPCPFNVDRAGRKCGGRNAYSRGGGARPLCFPTDVTAEQVQSARSPWR